MPDFLLDIWRYLRRHWWHALVAIGMFFLFTVVHEAAHALAAVLQGATIVEFNVLPTDGNLGHMSYNVPIDADFSHTLVSGAPYLLWAACMLIAIGLAAWRSDFSFGVGSSVFLWLFVAPWLDVLLNAGGWIVGEPTDFYFIFGHAQTSHHVALLIACLLVAALGYPLQRRLYPPDDRLNPAAYVGLVVLLGGMFMMGI